MLGVHSLADKGALMGAFIVGGLGFFLTVIVTIILILANESMHSYETKYPTAGIFWIGSLGSAAIVGSHFIGW